MKANTNRIRRKFAASCTGNQTKSREPLAEPLPEPNIEDQSLMSNGIAHLGVFEYRSDPGFEGEDLFPVAMLDLTRRQLRQLREKALRQRCTINKLLKSALVQALA